jgi:hypothetical protein
MSRRLRKLPLFAAVVLAVLAAPLAPAAASAYNDWSGVWSSNYGDITFSWDKGTLAATYGKNGKMTLKPGDPWAKVIRGTWNEGKLSGDAEFRMDEDMKGFNGWRNSPGNSWTGNRETVPEPID